MKATIDRLKHLFAPSVRSVAFVFTLGAITGAWGAVDYTRWSYANDILTWTSASVSDMGGASKFTLFDTATGGDTETVYTGNANTLYNGVTELFWHNFCYSGNAGSMYKAPGSVLRISGTTATSTIGGTFGPLTLGGMIVEEGATGYSMTQTGTGRSTVWGDPNASANALFLFNEDFTLNRTGVFFLVGNVELEVASGKTLTLTQAATTSGVMSKPTTAGGESAATTAGGVLKLSGGGTVAFAGGLTVNGGTLDYAGATISGNVTLSAGSTIVFPAGTATDETISAAVCTGTLTVPTTALMNVKIGDSEPVAALLTVSNGAITKIDTQLEKTFTSGYPAIVPAGCTYTYEGSGDSANPSNITSLAVYGTLRTKGQFNITGASSELNSTIEVVDGNTKLNSANTQTLKGNIVIDAGATLTNMRTSDAIQYSNSRTIDIYGTLAMGSTRWTVGGNTAINIHGGTITGAGEGSNGALDFIDTFSSSVSVVDDDTTIAANLRFRKTGVVFTVAEDKTLTCTGLMNQNGTKQVGSFAKQGTGKMLLTTAPTFTQTITLAAGTLNVGSLTLAAPIAATGTATVETTETIAVSSVSSGATLTVAGGNVALGTVRPEGAIVFTGTGNTLSTTFASTDETSYTLNVSGVDTANVTVYKADGTTVDTNASKTYNTDLDELTIAVSLVAIPAETTATTLADLGITSGNITLTADHDATVNLGSTGIPSGLGLTVATTEGAIITFVSDSILSTAIAGSGYQILYDIYKLRNAEPHPAITAPSGQTVCITNSCTVTDQAAEGYYDGTYTNTVTAAGTVKMLADAKLTSFLVPEGGTLEIVSGTTTLSKSSKAISGTLTVDVGATCAFSKTDIINYSGSPYINVYGTIDGGNSRQSVGDGAHLTFYTGSRVVGNGDGSNPYNSTIDLCGNNTNTRFALAEGVQEGTVTLACPWEFRGGKTNKWTIDSGVTVDWAGHEGKCVKASGGQGTFIVEGSGTLKVGGTMSSNAAITLSGGALEYTESVAASAILSSATPTITATSGKTVTGTITLAQGLFAPNAATAAFLADGDAWNGTVVVPAYANPDTEHLQVQLEKLGNAKSFITLNGLASGESKGNYLTNGASINAALTLGGDVIFNQGGSGQTYTFACITNGTGNLELVAWNGCFNNTQFGVKYVIGNIDADSYTGTLKVKNLSNHYNTSCDMQFAIGNIITDAEDNYGRRLVALETTVAEHTAGTDLTNTLTFDASSIQLNGADADLIFDASTSGEEGIYLATAEYNGTRFGTVSHAIDAYDADESGGKSLALVHVYSGTAPVPAGYELVAVEGEDYWTVADYREAVWQPGPDSDQRWNTAANWSINHVPLAGTKVYITGGETEYTKIWITGYNEPTTETCAGIVMSGLVELAPVDENGASSYPRLSVGGDIELADGATGTLRLFRAGLHNTCGGTTAITVEPDFLGNGANNSNQDSYLDNGPFIFDGNVTVQGKLRLFVNATFNGDVVVNGSSTLQGESSYTQTYNGDLTVHGGLTTTGAMVANGKTVLEEGSDNNAWINVGSGGATFNGDFEVATAMVVQNSGSLAVNGAATLGAPFTKRSAGAMTFANVTIADSTVVVTFDGDTPGTVAINGIATIADGVEWTLPTNLTYGDDVLFVLAGMGSALTIPEAQVATYGAKVEAGIADATVTSSGETDKTYRIASVAQVGDVKYGSLQTAIDAAEDGETVTLLASETAGALVSGNKSFTLVAGDYTFGTIAAASVEYALTESEGVYTVVPAAQTYYWLGGNLPWNTLSNWKVGSYWSGPIATRLPTDIDKVAFGSGGTIDFRDFAVVFGNVDVINTGADNTLTFTARENGGFYAIKQDWPGMQIGRAGNANAVFDSGTYDFTQATNWQSSVYIGWYYDGYGSSTPCEANMMVKGAVITASGLVLGVDHGHGLLCMDGTGTFTATANALLGESNEGVGTVAISNGTLNVGGTFIAGGGATTLGVLNMDGGALNVVNQFQLGNGENATGIVYQTAGTITVSSGQNNDVNWASLGYQENRVGKYYMTGGEFVMTNGFNGTFVIGHGNGGEGELYIGGSGVMTVNKVLFGEGADSVGTLALTNGGTLATKWIEKYVSMDAVTLTLDGGKLKALADQNGYFVNFGETLALGANGLEFDTDGHSVTIAQSLTGAATLTKSGEGALTLSAAPAETVSVKLNAGSVTIPNTYDSASVTTDAEGYSVRKTASGDNYVYTLASNGVVVDIDGCDFTVDAANAAAVTAATGVEAGDNPAFKKASIAYVLGAALDTAGEVVVPSPTIEIDGTSVKIDLALADSRAASFAITAKLQSADALASPIAWTDVAEADGVTPSETLSGEDKTANLVDVKAAAQKFYRVVVTIQDL